MKLYCTGNGGGRVEITIRRNWVDVLHSEMKKSKQYRETLKDMLFDNNFLFFSENEKSSSSDLLLLYHKNSKFRIDLLLYLQYYPGYNGRTYLFPFRSLLRAFLLTFGQSTVDSAREALANILPVPQSEFRLSD